MAAALILAACSQDADTHACGSTVAAVDEPLPEYEGELLAGEPVDLRAEYGNGLVVLNVWGAWCGPCRKEAPDLVAAADALEAQDVRFLGIDVRDSTTAAEQFVDEFGKPYPSVFDRPGRLAAALNVSSPPATLYVDDGRIYARQLGATTEDVIRCVVDEAGRTSDRSGAA